MADYFGLSDFGRYFANLSTVANICN